jgi:error-prone DNA polymerase
MRHSKLPDIDLDLPWDRRDEIMAWIYERYGHDKVAMIGGFARFKGRASVVEVAKAMGIPAHEAHGWSKRLPHGSLKKFLADQEGYVEARGAWSDERFREVLEQAADLHGLPRHPMMHPCGMVVADRPLSWFTPVGGSAKGFSLHQMSMAPIEDLGLLKMDLLGQAGLSVLRDCMENLRIELEEGRLKELGPVDPANPFGSMRNLLRLCRCADIDCLVATVSVIRPGAANEDKKTKFARRYLGLEPVEYAHPVLEEVLSDSFGLMIYEEHILLVANRFAGIDFGTADLLRRILIKKSDAGALDELEAVFRASASRRGRSEAEIETVWRELRDFSGFMFNKAHGAAYAIEAFQGCWLKFNWPIHFLAAVLSNQRGFYTALVYVMEILRQGGEFKLPDVQLPGGSYRVEGNVVRIPLWQIKGLRETFLDRWARALEKGPFRDWNDFVGRTSVEPGDAGLLARAGALRTFFPNRHAAVWHAGQVRSARGRGVSRWNEPDLFTVGPVPRSGFPEPEKAALSGDEAELLGYPVTLGPVDLWMADMNRDQAVPVKELARHVGREVWIAGIQVCHRLHRTLKGDLMKFVTVADETGMAETVIFPEAYRRHGWSLSQRRAARLRVYVERDETGSVLSLTVTGHED